MKNLKKTEFKIIFDPKTKQTEVSFNGNEADFLKAMSIYLKTYQQEEKDTLLKRATRAITTAVDNALKERVVTKLKGIY